MWDLSCEKLLKKYEYAEKEVQPFSDQVTHPIDILNSKSCPTAMAASESGNLVFMAYSDNSLKMIDTRVPDKGTAFLTQDFQGGHSDLIKSLCVSPDESVVYSGGTDSVLSVWDVAQQQVVQTFGQDKATRDSASAKMCEFHTDSIWSISQSSDSQSHIITTGKDGKIFMTDVAQGTHQKLFEASEPVICAAQDSASQSVWYGTNESSV